MTALLEVRQLVSGYGTGQVIRGIDLSIESGQVVALLGRNGVGKTTFVHTILGMVRPSSGSVRFDGEEVAGLPTHAIARHRIALVPQGRRVFGALTVEENLRIAVRDAPGPWTIDRVYELLPRLRERRRNRGHQLSGGEQQMLAIGRGLLGNPRLLLLDEPSDGLAPAVVTEIIDLLRSLCKGEKLAALLIEQDLRSAFALADTIHIMDRGRLVHSASTAAFRRDRATARRLLGVS
jgi:branched-chain amino acid transport system ATP-binding protein